MLLLLLLPHMPAGCCKYACWLLQVLFFHLLPLRASPCVGRGRRILGFHHVSPCFNVELSGFGLYNHLAMDDGCGDHPKDDGSKSFNPNIGRLQPSPMLELYSISSKPSKVAVVNTPWSDTNKYPQQVPGLSVALLQPNE